MEKAQLREQVWGCLVTPFGSPNCLSSKGSELGPGSQPATLSHSAQLTYRGSPAHSSLLFLLLPQPTRLPHHLFAFLQAVVQRSGAASCPHSERRDSQG